MNKTHETVATFDRYASQYEQRYRDYQPYLASYADFACFIDSKQRTLLDVACGPATFSAFLVDRFPELQVSGIDLAPAMLKLAREAVPAGDFSQLDCRELASLPGTFDILLLGFCLPYLDREDAARVVSDASAKLNENGLLYVSTMEGSYLESGCQTNARGDSVHIYFHSADFLIERLTRDGLTVLQSYRRPFNREDGSTSSDLFIFARKSGPARETR